CSATWKTPSTVWTSIASRSCFQRGGVSYDLMVANRHPVAGVRAQGIGKAPLGCDGVHQVAHEIPLRKVISNAYRGAVVCSAVVEIRPADSSRIAHIAEVIGRAFVTEPMMTWPLGGGTDDLEERCIRANALFLKPLMGRGIV